MSRDKQTEIDELQKFIAENTAVYDSDVAQDVAETLIYEGYRKSTDVAREIFEEIEASAKVKYWRGGGLVVFEVNGEDFAELKKKYTEEK